MRTETFSQLSPTKSQLDSSLTFRKTVLNFSGLTQNYIRTYHIPLPAPATTDHKSSLELTKAAAR